MSKTNQIATQIGYAPKNVVNSSVGRCFMIGATNEHYATAQRAKSTESVVKTMIDLGFSPAEAAEMAGE